MAKKIAWYIGPRCAHREFGVSPAAPVMPAREMHGDDYSTSWITAK
jgi:hypothetical protein